MRSTRGPHSGARLLIVANDSSVLGMPRMQHFTALAALNEELRTRIEVQDCLGGYRRTLDLVC